MALVGSATYEASDFEIIDDGTGSSLAYSGVPDTGIDLPGPGTYLVNVQSIFLAGPGMLFLDEPGASGIDPVDLGAFVELWSRSCAGQDEPVCQVSLPFVVPAGAPATVPLTVFALGEGSGCGCDTLPDSTTVTVFQMDEDPILTTRSAHRTTHVRGSVAAYLRQLRR